MQRPARRADAGRPSRSTRTSSSPASHGEAVRQHDGPGRRLGREADRRLSRELHARLQARRLRADGRERRVPRALPRSRSSSPAARAQRGDAVHGSTCTRQSYRFQKGHRIMVQVQSTGSRSSTAIRRRGCRTSSRRRRRTSRRRRTGSGGRRARRRAWRSRPCHRRRRRASSRHPVSRRPLRSARPHGCMGWRERRRARGGAHHRERHLRIEPRLLVHPAARRQRGVVDQPREPQPGHPRARRPRPVVARAPSPAPR